MSEFSVKHDTTPATHGDLDIWAGQLREVIKESAEDTKQELRQEIQDSAENVKEELRAEIKESAESVKAELRAEIKEGFDKQNEKLTQLQDSQLELILLVKSLTKKPSKK